jgi:hypothetical protein
MMLPLHPGILLPRPHPRLSDSRLEQATSYDSIRIPQAGAINARMSVRDPLTDAIARDCRRIGGRLPRQRGVKAWLMTWQVRTCCFLGQPSASPDYLRSPP